MKTMVTTTKPTTYRNARRPAARTSVAALASVASVASFLSPALALACPTARAAACGSCGGHSSLGSYLVAVGIGLLAGATSVGLEGRFRGRGNGGDR